jgi:hypothetical protein
MTRSAAQLYMNRANPALLTLVDGQAPTWDSLLLRCGATLPEDRGASGRPTKASAPVVAVVRVEDPAVLCAVKITWPKATFLRKYGDGVVQVQGRVGLWVRPQALAARWW